MHLHTLGFCVVHTLQASQKSRPRAQGYALIALVQCGAKGLNKPPMQAHSN
jgi:hypothetical protein